VVPPRGDERADAGGGERKADPSPEKGVDFHEANDSSPAAGTGARKRVDN